MVQRCQNDFKYLYINIFLKVGHDTVLGLHPDEDIFERFCFITIFEKLFYCLFKGSL